MCKVDFLFRQAAILFLFAFVIVFNSCIPSDALTDNRVETQYNDLTIRVEFYADDIVHVQKSMVKLSDTSLIVQPANKKIKLEKEENDTSIIVTSEKVKVLISKTTGTVRVYDKQNQLYLAEKNQGSIIPATVLGDPTFNLRQTFAMDKDEALYGLGQFQNGIMNYRGHEVLLAQSNSNAVVPFLLSTKKYGILWDNYSKSIFKDVPDSTYLWSEMGDAINYYVVTGETMDEVIAGYRQLTGKAPLFGKWAYGFWQCKERYKTGDELLDVVKEYRQRNIPLDNIIQDWQYWPEGEFSGMTWDSTRYPHPEKTFDALNDLNTHIMVSIWPALGSESEIYNEMEKKGLLLDKLHWGNARLYDAFSKEGRDIYWKYLKEGLFDKGVDAFWMDGTEPEFMSTGDRYVTEASIKANKTCALGNIARYLNLYSYYTTKGVYNNQRETTDKKRVYILTRSAFAGQQAYGAATWSGDIHASWQVFRDQITAGMNISMAGIPYWTSDIGAFLTRHNYPGAPESNAYKELYLRWYQFGAFNSIFRAHGTDIPREIWQFGEKGEWAYDGIAKMNDLRYRLMPYIYSTAWKVTDQGYSFLRALPLEYPEDKNVREIEDQYMFGESFMVCPVTQPLFYDPGYEAENIPAYRILDRDGNNGANLEFYKGSNFNEKVEERKSGALKLSWFGDLPLEVRDTTYSVRWNGQIRSDEAGEYTFKVTTNGGVRFWLNGELIVDQWDNKTMKSENKEVFKLSPARSFNHTVAFDANTLYSFKLENRQYVHNEANIFVEWSTPSTREVLKVPAKKGREVYLPGTTNWYDFWTGKSYSGGQTISVPAPRQQIPLFVKAGSIIPMGKITEYTGATDNEMLSVKIYPGTNGSFLLYEDEGDTYNYEQGAYSLIPFSWNDEDKTLVIGNRQGSFNGMVTERTFKISLAGLNQHAGLDLAEEADKTVTYSGEVLKVQF